MKTSKTSKKSNVETNKVNVVAVAKENTKQTEKANKKAQKEAEKVAKKAERAAKNEYNKSVRESEKSVRSYILTENKKYSKQFAILFNYVVDGCFDNHFKLLGLTLDSDQKVELMKSITTAQMFRCSKYYSVDEKGNVHGCLKTQKVVLRDETESNCELYTNVLVKKVTFTLSDLLGMFMKVLRRKYTSILVKTEPISQSNEEFLLEFEEIKEKTLSDYKAGKISVELIKERSSK